MAGGIDDEQAREQLREHCARHKQNQQLARTGHYRKAADIVDDVTGLPGKEE